MYRVQESNRKLEFFFTFMAYFFGHRLDYMFERSFETIATYTKEI